MSYKNQASTYYICVYFSGLSDLRGGRSLESSAKDAEPIHILILRGLALFGEVQKRPRRGKCNGTYVVLFSSRLYESKKVVSSGNVSCAN